MSNLEQQSQNSYQVEINPERVEALTNLTITGPMSIWAGWKADQLPLPVRAVLLVYGAFQVGRSGLYVLEKAREMQLHSKQSQAALSKKPQAVSQGHSGETAQPQGVATFNQMQGHPPG